MHQYQELAPAPPLRRFIECYWRATSIGAPGFRAREPLVPDLRIELIFNAGEAWRWSEDGAIHRSAALTCIGMRGRALMIQQPGKLDHFAIRFRPAGLAAFLRVPLAELTQRCWNMHELWPRLAPQLEAQLAAADGDAARVALTDRFLLAHLRSDWRAVEPALAATGRLLASHGALSIDRLAADSGESYKSLERRFARDVGLSPKHVARIARLQRALALASVSPRLHLAALAADSGYADQAHLTRDFARLIGVSPRAFFAERFAVFETMADSGSLEIRPIGDARARV